MAPRPTPPVKLYYRIGEVADVVGVEPHVLRYWESEFGTIRPQKSPKGQRVYSRKDLEKLLKVKELLYGQGYTIAGAKKRLRELSGTARSSDVASEANNLAPSLSPIAHSGEEAARNGQGAGASTRSRAGSESARGPLENVEKAASVERARAHFSIESFDTTPLSRRAALGSVGPKPEFEAKKGVGFSFVVEGEDDVSTFEAEQAGGNASRIAESLAARSVWNLTESSAREPTKSVAGASPGKIPDLFSSEREGNRFDAPPSLFDIALLETEGGGSNFPEAHGRDEKGDSIVTSRSPQGETRSTLGPLKSELIELRQRIASELSFLSHAARRWEGR